MGGEKGPDRAVSQVESAPREISKLAFYSHTKWDYRRYNINNRGVLLDNWSDLIENMGGAAAEVRNGVYWQLSNRKMPDVKVEAVTGTTRTGFWGLGWILGGILSEERPYIITETSPGATTTIYVEKYGKDLFVGWRTFIRRVLNWRTIIAMIIISLVLAFMQGLSVRADADTEVDFLGPIGTIINALCFVASLGLAFGYFITLCAISIGAGIFLFRDPFIFLIKIPSYFDADDIVAMSLAAHLSIKTSLEAAGISTDLLRKKPEFTDGRRSKKT